VAVDSINVMDAGMNVRRQLNRRDPRSVAPAGILMDIDGVLHVSYQPIPGAAEALRALADLGIPCRFLTNTTTATRASLAASLRSIGLPVHAEDVLTAPMATVRYLQQHFPGARCYLIAKGDVAEEFAAAGIELVPDDDAVVAEVVVIGGAEERLTYERLNRAFRLILRGAKLIAMHRNRWWRTASGLQLDSGPFVTALEEATGTRAITIGKPALPFFRAGRRALGLPYSHIVMVGDDAANDLQPARKLGMRTVLVRTGKPVHEKDEQIADITLDSVAALPEALATLMD
jgi:HAD superfamily hydrolase (TIGR01458 family)